MDGVAFEAVVLSNLQFGLEGTIRRVCDHFDRRGSRSHSAEDAIGDEPLAVKHGRERERSLHRPRGGRYSRRLWHAGLTVSEQAALGRLLCGLGRSCGCGRRCGRFAPVDADVGEGGLDCVLELPHDLGLHALSVDHKLRRPLPRARKSLDKMTTDGMTDAEGKDACGVAVFCDEADDLVRVADLPIRQHKYLARISLDLGPLQNGLHGVQQLSPAQIGLQRLCVGGGRGHRLVVVLCAFLEKKFVRTSKTDNVEVAIGRKRTQKDAHCICSLCNLGSFHRSATINHENDLCLDIIELKARNQRHHGSRVGAVALKHSPVLVSAWRGDKDNKIAVHRRGAERQRGLTKVIVRPLVCDCMSGRSHGCDSQRHFNEKVKLKGIR
eukprot:Opistho-2@78017